MSSGSKDWSRKRGRDVGDEGDMKSSNSDRYSDDKDDNDNANDEDEESPQRSATNRSYYGMKNDDGVETSPTAVSSRRGGGGSAALESTTAASSRHASYHPSQHPPHHMRGGLTAQTMLGDFPPPYPMHPPISGSSENSGYPPAQRGYEGSGGPPPPGYPSLPPHPYAVPPGYAYMHPYPMYPGYYPPHPMYGHPHHQQGPHYPYPTMPHDPNMVRYPSDAVAPDAYPPYGPRQRPPLRVQRREADRKRSTGDSSQSGGSDDEMGDEDDSDLAAGETTARLKTYIKPRIPSTQEVLDRRARKNSQSRARAAKLRVRITEIEQKAEDERTEEEVGIWNQYEQRRQRKNNRSRERALEKKEEIERIASKSDKKRSKIEKQFLETALSAKKRKNEGDRLRRQRLKELGLSTKGTGVKPGISARGPLPAHYQHLQPQQQRQPPQSQRQQSTFGQMMHPSGSHNMGEIPMSPLPHHHPLHMHSPPFGSPNIGGLAFPSPAGSRTPGRAMPYIPPQHEFGDASPAQVRAGSQLVEQTRHPDGSMSFSIDGRGSSSGTGATGRQRSGNRSRDVDGIAESKGAGNAAGDSDDEGGDEKE